MASPSSGLVFLRIARFSHHPWLMPPGVARFVDRYEDATLL
jgi:hypothetical protein